MIAMDGSSRPDTFFPRAKKEMGLEVLSPPCAVKGLDMKALVLLVACVDAEQTVVLGGGTVSCQHPNILGQELVHLLSDVSVKISHDGHHSVCPCKLVV